MEFYDQFKACVRDMPLYDINRYTEQKEASVSNFKIPLEDEQSRNREIQKVMRLAEKVKNQPLFMREINTYLSKMKTAKDRFEEIENLTELRRRLINDSRNDDCAVLEYLWR